MKYTVPWWGSLGLSFLIALMLVGDRPLSLFGVLLLWPFVAFVLHCIMGYWQTQEDAEQRRLRNTGPLVEGPPPDHEHLRCPQCGSAKVGWSQEYERIFCWYCRPVESPIEEAADDEPFRCPTCGSTNAKRLSDLETVCYDCRPVVHTVSRRTSGRRHYRQQAIW